MKKRILSLILAAVLAVPTVAMPVSAADADDVVVHYDMSYDNGYLKDMSGNDNDAKLYKIDEDDFSNVYGDSILKFPGTDGAYAELPVSIKNGLDYKNAFSVEMTLVPKSAQFQFLWTIGTGFQTDYLFFNPRLGDSRMNVAIKTAANNNQENTIPGAMDTVLDTAEYSLVTVTSSGNTLKLYVNGEEKGTLNHSHNLDNIFGGNANGVLGYLAKSNWNDPYSDAEVTDFKIYSKTLSASEVRDNYDEMEAVKDLKYEAEKVSLPAYTFEDLDLPVKGSLGSSITWKSSDAEFVSDEGKIMKEVTESKEVTLTATFTDKASGASATRDFVVLIVKSGAEGKLDFVSSQFDLGISYVTEDITLVDEFEGVKITWTGNDLITKTGKVTRPEEDTEVVLKAVFTSGDVSVEKEYSVTVAAETAGYLASYIAKYEYNIGPEEAEFPGHKYDGFNLRPTYDYSQYTDNQRTDVMFYAISEDGEEYTSLNNDKGIVYPKGMIQMGSPSLFRKADGTYGLVASVNNDTNQVMIWDSEDLIFFTNQRTVALASSNIKVQNPTMEYDNATGKYELYWEGSNGKSYVSYSSDLVLFEDAKTASYTKEEVDGELPIYARTEEASVFELTAEEVDRLQKKFGDVYSVDVEVEDVRVKPGEKVTLADTVDVVYNDGSTKTMGVEWDVKGSGLDLKNPKEGTYTITGTVQQDTYASPLAECRADPYVVYDEEEDLYYFTSSYMQANMQNAYDRLIIRCSDTLSGLTDAEEIAIWDGSRGEPQPVYWAPELHKIGDYWRVIMLSVINGAWQMTILTCTGGDLLDPNDWEYTGYVKPATNGGVLGAFDTTFFEYDGVCYYFSPAGGNINVTTFDPDDPLTPTSPLIAISTPTYAWERNLTTGQNIEEGSAIMTHNGKIYLTYAAATVDNFYAVAMIYADLDDDLMDPASWTKYPFPVLSSADLTTTVVDPDYEKGIHGKYEGLMGPGHNSLTFDSNGNHVIVHHARDWGDDYTNGNGKYGLQDPGRHAYARNIHFGADGFPIFNMTPEQELAEELKTVTMTVTVSDKQLPYTDVAKGDWFYDAVEYTYYEGLMTGMEPTLFGPYGNLSRAQFALMLYRMEGTPEVTAESKFADIKGDEWYGPAVLWAAKNGIVTGYLDGNFGPVDLITREQMAVMMHRYADYLKVDTDSNASFDSFKDADKVSTFATEAVGWATGNGIITGKDNGTVLDPQGYTARSEAAIIIQRFMTME